MIILVAAAVANGAAAQQPNQPGVANMVINGLSLPSGPMIGISAPQGSTITFAIDGPANAPFLTVVTSSLLNTGVALASFSNNLLDLDLSAGFAVVYDGTSNPLASMNPVGQFTGQFALNATTPIGLRAAAQTAVASPATLSARLTAASEVVVTPSATTTIYPSISANFPVTFDLAALGLSFPFYANTYTSLEIHEYGFINLSPGPADFSSSPSEFQDGPPRIAPLWADLNVAVNPGVISVVLDPTRVTTPFTTVTVNWAAMSNGILQFPGNFNFSTTLTIETGDIDFNYGGFTAGFGSTIITGLSPGNSLDPTWPPPLPFIQHDLSTFTSNPRLGQLNEALFEWFGVQSNPYWTIPGQNPFDLAGGRVSFLAGNPGQAGALYYGF